MIFFNVLSHPQVISQANDINIQSNIQISRKIAYRASIHPFASVKLPNKGFSIMRFFLSNCLLHNLYLSGGRVDLAQREQKRAFCPPTRILFFFIYICIMFTPNTMIMEGFNEEEREREKKGRRTADTSNELSYNWF